ncbi:MAG: hypothetical protein ACQESG_08470 [Nanobdellota archaeon]
MFDADVQLAHKFVEAHLPGVDLVLVTGSRVFGITETDFDLCVVGDFPESQLCRYAKFVSLPKQVYSGVEFEVEVVTWKEIEQGLADYLSFTAWHYQQAHVLHDPTGQFARLKEKYSFPQECEGDLLRFYEWAYDHLNNARKAHMRGMYATQISHLSESFQAGLCILFLLNRSFIPPIKWRLYLADSLPKKVDYEEGYKLSFENVEAFIDGVRKLLVGELSPEDIARVEA